LNPQLARLIFLPTYAWNLLLGRVLKSRNWWDEVEPGLLLGARPLRRDVANFAQMNVNAVVNMCEEYRGPVDLYEKHSIDQLWLPTTDFQAPTLEQVIQGVEYIQARLQPTDSASSKVPAKVYVHCKAGRARSATIVLCWLVKYRNMTPELAQQRLLEVRPHVHPEIYLRKVVQEFVKTLEPRSELSSPSGGSLM
jgi:atypical dual specificity phosphatase